MKPTIPPITEAAFMAQVLQLAKHCGWKVYHTFDSRRSAVGFPDLILLRGPRILAIELKRSQKAKLTPEQGQWIEAFRAAGAEAWVWFPEVWDTIEEVLR